MATKVSKGRYRTQVYIGEENGKRKYKTFYAPTASEADFLALQYKHDKKEYSDPGRITVGEAIDRYIDSKTEILSPTTIAGYRVKRRNNFKSLMNIRVADVTQAMLQEAVNNERKTYSAKSVKDAYAVVKSGITMFRPNFAAKVTLPQKLKIKRNIPGEAELSLIFAAAKGTRLEIPVLLAAWMSLRASEVIGLKWEDVYDTYIEVRTARVYAEGKIHEKGTKTDDSTRRIPLPKYIKSLLDEKPRDSEYVCDMTGSALYKAFVRMLEKNDIPHYRFHDLRHSNASMMVKLHIPDTYAQQRGGWADGTILSRHYQHTFPDEELRVAAIMDECFDKLVQPKMQPVN